MCLESEEVLEVAALATELKRLEGFILTLKAEADDDICSLQLSVRSDDPNDSYAEPIYITANISAKLLGAIEEEKARCHSALIRLLTAGDDDPIE